LSLRVIGSLGHWVIGSLGRCFFARFETVPTKFPTRIEIPAHTGRMTRDGAGMPTNKLTN